MFETIASYQQQQQQLEKKLTQAYFMIMDLSGE